VVSAYAIPSLAEGWSNILAFDVFHHLADPMRFIRSAANALEPGGRIILCEPAATILGRFFYRAFHEEPCEPRRLAAPYEFQPDRDGRFANMGMAWAMFERDRETFEAQLTMLGLKLSRPRFRDL